MACYLFQNGSVFFKDHDEISCMTWDEFLGSSMRQDKNAHVLIVESDGPGFFDQVREIRRAFPPGAIKTFVSYAAALRVFLEERKLIAPGESVAVVDVCGDKLLLTALMLSPSVLTRVIPQAEGPKVMEEVRRTQRNVVEKDGKAPRGQAMRVVTNHSDLSEAVFFETAFPVFEVLGRVKFPAQLMPPEDVARIKRQKLLKEFLMLGAVSLLVAGAGGGFWVYALGQEATVQQSLERLTAEKTEIMKEISRLGALTYQDRLKVLPRTAFADVTDIFIRHVLTGARIEAVAFDRGAGMDWGFTGTISFPRQEIFPFVQEGIFSGAQINDIFVQGKPGKRVHIYVGAVHEPPVRGGGK